MPQESQSSQPSQAGNLNKRVASVLRSAAALKQYQDILTNAGVQDPNEALLGLEVLRLVSGTRDADQFIQDLVKGFGVGEPQARQVALSIASQVLSPLTDELPVSLREVMKEWEGEIEKSGGDTQSDVFGKTDEDEIERVKGERAAVLQLKTPLDMGDIVKNVCEHPTFAFQDQLLQDRCRKIVDSRVRDVRDAFETRRQLERPIDQGGLGVSGRRLADMLETLEAQVHVYQSKMAEEQGLMREQKKAQITQEMAERDLLAKKEEHVLSKQYISLTGQMPKERVAPVAPPLSRTSVALSAHHEMLQREGKIDTQKVRAVVEEARKLAPSKKPLGTPSMQEVAFTKRLMGPVDELRALTITDFHRLSKDPVQAAAKIRDKVSLLEEEGYHKKVEAIQAWRASPLNQMYVALTREAVLVGIPVAELLMEKRKKGEVTLEDTELKAIMQLNADLRF